MSEKKSGSGARAIFYWLLAGTALYVAVLLALAAQTELCPPVPNYRRSYWLLDLLDDYLRCRPLNELGDFLAGAFATVAFIWLVGAVLIQSRELAAQRQELTLARDEARQTREVLSRQAEESRAATTYIAEQTDILKREQAQREQQEANREFDQMLNVFMSRNQKVGIWVTCRADGDPHGKRFFRLHDGKAETSDEFLARLIEGARTFVKKPGYEGLAPIQWHNSSRLNFMVMELRDIEAFSDKLSPAYKQRANALRISALLTALEDVSTRVNTDVQGNRKNRS